MKQGTAIWMSTFLALVVPLAIFYGIDSPLQKICLSDANCRVIGLEKFQKLIMCGVLSASTVLVVFYSLNRKILLRFSKSLLVATTFVGLLLGPVSDSFITNYPILLGVTFSWIFISAAAALISLLVVKYITS